MKSNRRWGKVYRARDTRLQRRATISLLCSPFQSFGERSKFAQLRSPWASNPARS